MIEVKHLRKKYSRGKEVISDLSLTFGETGLNVVCGKSGCGKTTLINILGAMDRDFEGSVVADGLDLGKANYTQIADYRNFTSAFVFQKNSLFEFLTVEENLQLCLNIQNNDSNISEALERVGLAGFEKKKVKALSGGEKQRVAIARALIKDSKIVFADEPTSALDSKNAHKIFQLLKDLSKDRLVIVVTHDIKKATMYADRLIRLIDGNIEEDITYNELNVKARELKEKKSKPFSMMPIFKYNLKTGMLINLFVIILLIASLCITNIAIEQKKVKNEYDNFTVGDDSNFNVDRAIKTQIINGVNLYQIAKSGDATDEYYYLRNATGNYDTNLSEGDCALIESNFNKYDIYKGTNDIEYPNLFIKGISTQQRMSAQGTDGIYRYWYTYEPTNYTYYTYDKDYKYDLVAGRLPKTDNEILITDTIADQYLRNRAYAPGVTYEPYYANYVVDYNDILSDTYTVYDTVKQENVTLDNYITIFDVYGDYIGTLSGTRTYYLYNEVQYKVVGIINTGILPFYTYSYDSTRYYLIDNFETQTGSEEFMNSLKYQPGGYAVIPNGLKSTNENQNYQDPHEITAVKVNGKEAKNYIAPFFGKYDYTENGLAGYTDNLLKDHDGRILAKGTTSDSLKDDEVIISVDLAKKLFPSIGITSYNASVKYSNINGREVEFEFVTGYSSYTTTLKIVGVAKNSNTDIYISDNLFSDLYIKQKGLGTTLTINLDGYSVKQRENVFKKLYDLGYSLIPYDNMPGAFLEFVEGKGEMICEVDYEGLASLYPSYTVELDESTNRNLFVVDGVKYGYISGEYVYMNSSIIRQITLDDSYYTSKGNLSPYYLFSDYYNSSIVGCNTNSDKGNSILEIIDGLYQFFLVVALILAIGFIYLKELRQSSSVTKLSMLGVRNKDLVLLNLLTYIPMAIIVGILTLLCSMILVNVINNMYSYSFVNYLKNAKVDELLKDANGNYISVVTTVKRIRLMFTTSSYLTTIFTTLGVMIVTLFSSIFVTLKSRK